MLWHLIDCLVIIIICWQAWHWYALRYDCPFFSSCCYLKLYCCNYTVASTAAVSSSAITTLTTTTTVGSQPVAAAATTTTDIGPIKATTPMWRCSRIMHVQRDMHPTVLSALEGIVDQVCTTSHCFNPSAALKHSSVEIWINEDLVFG